MKQRSTDISDRLRKTDKSTCWNRQHGSTMKHTIKLTYLVCSSTKEDAIEATKQDKTRVQGKTTNRVRSRRQDSASGARKKKPKNALLECYEMFGTGPLKGHALSCPRKCLGQARSWDRPALGTCPVKYCTMLDNLQVVISIS